MSQANERFVPSGVNAQSWIGFEQRISERRFRALLETMDNAIAAGDAIDARVALEEARELRPGAPELADVESRLATIPMVIPAAAPNVAWSRALGGILLLVIGIGLLIGVEWIRQPVAMPRLAPLATAPLRLASPLSAPPFEAAVGTSGREPSLAASSPTAPRLLYRRTQPARSRALAAGETPDDYFVPRPRPTTNAPAPLRRLFTGGEIPDDYVVPRLPVAATSIVRKP